MADPLGITDKVGEELPFSNDLPNIHSTYLLLSRGRDVSVPRSVIAWAGDSQR